MTAAVEWRVWSTTARLVVTDQASLAPARDLVERRLAEIDAAASRFRADSEVRRVEQTPDRPVRVSPLLAELVRAALRAARRTDGDVDPTVGARLCALGYDQDLDPQRPGPAAPSPAEASPAGAGPAPAPARVSVRTVTDWTAVRLDDDRLTLPAGVRLDLGATAKAYAADRCAAEVAAAYGGGVVISLGGDIATAGEGPARGWAVRVQDGPDEPGCTIGLPAGGALATSSTLHRRWSDGARDLHHIIDPRRGVPAVPVWRTASAAAGDCVTANTATTAALVRGPDAPRYLAATGLPARLVGADGRVHTFGGWPTVTA